MQIKAMLLPRDGRYSNTDISKGQRSRVHVACGPNGIRGIPLIVDYISLENSCNIETEIKHAGRNIDGVCDTQLIMAAVLILYKFKHSCKAIGIPLYYPTDDFWILKYVDT